MNLNLINLRPERFNLARIVRDRRLRLIIGLLLFSGCASSSIIARDPQVSGNCPTGVEFGIFTVSADGRSAEVDGVIFDRTLNDFNCMMARHPNIVRLDLIEVPGADVSDLGDSLSDSSLELGRAVFDHGLHTHLVDGGLAASGGTDLLAAGRTITIGHNTEVGVHAWGGGWDGREHGTATDIAYHPNHTHPGHERYLRYYPDVGFDPTKGCQFYFFTIQAATVDDIHNMSDQEIELYLDQKAVAPTRATPECP